METSKRNRDVGRKYESGSTKRKLRAKRKTESEKLKGALNKYLKIGNADKEPDEKSKKDADENNEKDENNNKNEDEKESNGKD